MEGSRPATFSCNISPAPATAREGWLWGSSPGDLGLRIPHGDPRPSPLPAPPAAFPRLIPSRPRMTSWRETEPALIQGVCRDREKGVPLAEGPSKCLGRAPSCGQDAGWLWEQGTHSWLPLWPPYPCPGASLHVTVAPTR